MKKSGINLKNTIGCLLIALVSVFLMIKFQTIENDYAVYDRAGRDYLKGNNPWQFTGDVNNTYLYGPLSTIFLSLYTLFPLKLGVTLLRLMTLILLYILAFQNKDSSPLRKLGVLGLALSLFPVRANLEYGNFTIILCALLWLFKPNGNLIKQPLVQSIVFGVLCATSFDYKPHLFFPIAVLAVTLNRDTRTTFFSAIAFGAIASSIQIHENAANIWIRAIINRALESSSDKTDQMNFHATLNQLGLDLGYLKFLYLALIISCMIYLIKPRLIRKSFLLASLVIFPFLHSSDVGILLVLLLVFGFPYLNSTLGRLSMGLLVVWSESITGLVLASASLVLFYFLQSEHKNRMIDYCVLLAPNALFSLIAWVSSENTDVFRHVLNLFGVALALFLQEKDGTLISRLGEYFFKQVPIYVRSTGGFGNRLFALTFAHYLQSKSGRRVAIDVKGAPQFIERMIEDCTHVRRDKFGIGQKLLFLNLILKKLGFNRLNRHTYVFGDSYNFVEIQTLTKMIYVSGFYQNAKYVIESDYEWFLELDNAMSAIAPPRSVDTTVSEVLAMHIRRGDLLASGETRGVLDLAYFRKYSSLFKGRSVILTDADGREFNEIQSYFPNATVIGNEVPVELAYLVMIRAQDLLPSNSTLSWFASLHRYRSGMTPGRIPYPFFESGPPTPEVLGVDYLGSNPATYRES